MSVASFTENGVYPEELLAKKLNNRASFLLSTGKYEKCISLLTTALNLSERSSNLSDKKQPCPCQSCSLETSLSTDQDSFLTMMSDHEKEGTHNNNIKKKKKKNESIDNNEMMEYDDIYTTLFPFHRQTSATQHYRDSSSESSLTKENGFVYSRPLLVNTQCIEDRHLMGINLSLIILFNLALAHHLLAIEERAKKDKNGKNILPLKKSKRLQQALRIYEFAYNLYQQTLSSRDNNNNISNDCDEGTEYNRAVGKLKLTMIVSNNIGEIHRVAGDPIKHNQSLQHLLSLMMYLVDDSSDLVVFDSNEMDEFYHNLIPIILDDVCAQVA